MEDRALDADAPMAVGTGGRFRVIARPNFFRPLKTKVPSRVAHRSRPGCSGPKARDARGYSCPARPGGLAAASALMNAVKSS